ncbi:MAG: transketolase, partial [Alphaproteobacteria bacterium]|nr:transketolase [Alphaproteobacteria bacterium]
APEGGAHQSSAEPLIGLAQAGLASFEPAFVDELAVLMRWAFAHIQEEAGSSVYLRLSTRPLAQPARTIDERLAEGVIKGAYWLIEPPPGAELVIACCGAVTPEALAAHEAIAEEMKGVGVLAVTSPDRLHADWLASRRPRGKESHVAGLLKRLAPEAALVTVIDAHPGTLSWLGGVAQHRIVPLGVDRFGQSGDIPDLYRAYGLDRDAILDAVASACLDR